MEINGERLKKSIARRELNRLDNLPDDEKDGYIRAYSDGVTDAIELILEQIEEQLKEGT